MRDEVKRGTVIGKELKVRKAERLQACIRFDPTARFKTIARYRRNHEPR